MNNSPERTAPESLAQKPITNPYQQQLTEHDAQELQEQSSFFSNEEKVIVNNLKVNMVLQVVVIASYLFAATCTFWTHVVVEGESPDFPDSTE